jgi:hypothetical protein
LNEKLQRSCYLLKAKATFGIRDLRAISLRDGVTCLKRGCAWVTIKHAKALKCFEGVGLLREVQLLCIATDVDAQVTAEGSFVRSLEACEEGALEVRSMLVVRESKEDVVYVVDEVHVMPLGWIAPDVRGVGVINLDESVIDEKSLERVAPGPRGHCETVERSPELPNGAWRLIASLWGVNVQVRVFRELVSLHKGLRNVKAVQGVVVLHCN